VCVWNEDVDNNCQGLNIV